MMVVISMFSGVRLKYAFIWKACFWKLIYKLLSTESMMAEMYA